MGRRGRREKTTGGPRKRNEKEEKKGVREEGFLEFLFLFLPGEGGEGGGREEKKKKERVTTCDLFPSVASRKGKRDRGGE